MRTIDYKDLEVFSVVAEEGSIRAAAVLLNLSQPSVSRRMSRLEQCLGTELLDRSTRGAVLTTAGRRLLPFIDRGKALMSEMLMALERSSSTTTLEVWTDPTLAAPVMAFVCEALDGLPVELSNRVASADRVMRAIEHGPADVAFAPRCACPEGVESVPLFRDRLCFVVQPDHPLASLAQVSLDDLAKHEVAVAEWGEGSEQVVERLRSAGIPPERLRPVAPAGTAAMLSYRCGHVGVSPRSGVLAALREGLLVEVAPAELEPVDVEVHLVYRRSDALDEGVRAILRAVEDGWDSGAVQLLDELLR